MGINIAQSVTWWPGRPNKTGTFVHQAPHVSQSHLPPAALRQYAGYSGKGMLQPLCEPNGYVTRISTPVTDQMSEAIPNSTSITLPDIHQAGDTQVAEVCNTDNRVQVEEIDSNPYRNISMWVNDEEVTIVGTKSAYKVTTCPTLTPPTLRTTSPSHSTHYRRCV